MIPADRAKQPIYQVDPRRLHSGTWDGERIIGEGDICKSYSADRISEDKPVRPPFQFQGSLWTCTGMVGRAGVQDEASAYRLLPRGHFPGEALSFGARTASEELCEAARNDPMGSYHGVIVRHKGQECVLCGPEATFIPEENGTSEVASSAVQLGLF